MNHCVNRVKDLMYKGCEDHWQCKYCGDAWPIHCWTKHDLETQECPEGTPQAPDQADDTSVQPTAVTAEDALKLIRLHNLTVETLDRVGTTIRIQGAQIMGAIEMWHRIACEGAEIVDIARQLGIDATIDMQKGKINLKSQQNS